MSQFFDPGALSVQQRAYIALYGLQLGLVPRADVLARHQLTEADLEEHRAGWEQLLADHADRNRPMPRPEAEGCRLAGFGPNG